MERIRHGRRRLSLAATLSASIAIAIAGVSAAQSPAEGPQIGPELCAGSTYVLGYDVFSDTENFAAATIEGMNRAATAVGCVELVTLIDNADPTQAVANARTFVQREVDGAMLFNVIAAAGPGMANELAGAGIPLVSIVVEIEGSPFLGVSEYDAGFMGGQALGQAFVEAFPDELPYAINGRFDPSGETSGIPRMNGFRDGILSVFPDLPPDNYLEIETNADPPTAQARTLDVLNLIPPEGRIILGGINDQNTYAMFQATRQANRQDQTMVMGIGGVKPSGLEFICQNPQYVGAVGFFPENWPDYMISAMLALIQGQDVPPFTEIPTAVITRDNMADYYPDFEC